MHRVFMLIALPYVMSSAKAQDATSALSAVVDSEVKTLFSTAVPDVVRADTDAALTHLKPVREAIAAKTTASHLAGVTGYRAFVVEVTYFHSLSKGVKLGTINRNYKTVSLFADSAPASAIGESKARVQELVGATKTTCTGYMVPPLSLEPELLAQLLACLYTR